MKRTKPMLWAAALGCLAALALPSCSNGLLKDPRLYNGSNKQAAAPEVAPEPELGFVEGMNAFDETDKWYNKRDSNGDEQEPDKAGFDASEFDTIQITGWFSNQNVPTYTMTKKDVWSSGDAAKREFVHAGAPDTEGQGWAINGVRYYQYRGINPGYAADGNYNQTLQVTTPQGNPQLSRFYFYRFTGKGGGIQALDNYLIAVDTYSKLVFAFSEPVQFSTFGAPTKWDPTDNEKFNGMSYQFYMYDPVGYVLKKDDGSYDIKLYQWFQDNLAKGNYKASIQGFNDIAEKRVDGQGKSPFNNQRVDFFNSNLKLLAGKTFTYREKMDNGGYGLKLHTFIISADGKTLTRKTTVWNGLEENPPDVTYQIGDGESATKGAVSGGDDRLGWLEIKDGRTLVLGKDGTATETATTSFQDHGPQFLERVRHNPTYKSADGKNTYVFKAGSPNKLIMNGKEYTYAGKADHTNSTIYEHSGWFYGVELTGNDFTVKMTVRSGYHAIQWYTLGWAAHLDVEEKETFIDNVAGKTFKLREKDEAGLWGLDLLTYSFDDGGNATFTRTPWQKEGKTESHTVANGSDGTKGTVNGQQARLDTEAWTLTIDGKVYAMDYNDLGPSFLNRVKHDPSFVSSDGKTTYTFSDGGRKLQMQYTGGFLGFGNFDYKYDYVQPRDDSSTPNCAVYGSKDATLYYAGFELVEGDTVIQCSNESAGWAETIIWRMTYQANLVSQ